MQGENDGIPAGLVALQNLTKTYAVIVLRLMFSGCGKPFRCGPTQSGTRRTPATSECIGFSLIISAFFNFFLNVIVFTRNL